MAAYAALVSLMNVMDHIQYNPRLSTSLDKKQVESLGEKVCFLLDFIESSSHSHGGSEEDEDLESQIAFAAHAAEDVIESHVVDLILGGSTDPKKTSPFSYPILGGSTDPDKTSLSYLRKAIKDIKKKAMKPMYPWLLKRGLKKVIEEMDSIEKKVIKIKEKRGFIEQQHTYQSSALSTSSTLLKSNIKSAMVGFEDDLLQLMDALTGKQSKLQIIPIVGMGGIGKTTLARNVYENHFIVQHFEICAWVTVSQEYCVRKILLELLSCQRRSTSEVDGKDEAQLGEQLYKSLFGMRYLIVLDDMWSIDVWDEISRFLPNNNSRSRVVVTTRLLDIANHFSSWCHAMSFLDEDKSWELFCQKAFGEGGCPPELEGIGKKIVKECKGLPLSIVIIGGVLGKSIKRQEYWENVAKDENSILNSGVDGESLDVLSLSYNHLPAHLKPCFLYMGVFPEDHVIRVSQLIKLWVAEGFIKPNKSQSLEEAAEGYLKDLVERNLVLLRRLGSNGEIKTCSIHDLLRDLCLKVAEKEKFLCVTRARDRGRVRIFHAFVSTLLTGSSNLVTEGGKLSLRVLNVVDNDSSLRDIFEQVNLRYVCKSYSLISDCIPPVLPSSIFRLWNLQTLIIRGKERFSAPDHIWMMRQLRHLEFDEIHLPQPPVPFGFSLHPSLNEVQTALPNLQTLLKLVNLGLSVVLCMTIPNVKKLKLKYDSTTQYYRLYNLNRLQKLESLSCFFSEAPKWDNLLQNLKFPSSLKKLSLRNCNLRWEDLTMVGSLPHLEVLKLMGWNSILGSE